MNSTNRLWAFGAVTIMVVVLVAGWFLGVQPQLDQAAKNDLERSGIEAQNQANLAQIAVLTEQNKKLDTIQADYKELQKSIPSSPGSAAFIQGLNDLASNAGVQVKDIAVSDNVAYTIPESVAAAAPTDGSTPSQEATTDPQPTEPAAGFVTATSPLVTPENFVGIRVSVSVRGSYQGALDFVKGLQSGSRLMLVSGLSINSAADDTGLVLAQVDGMIYVLKQGS